MRFIEAILMIVCSGQFTVDVVPSFSVDVKTATKTTTRREWYLVSEPWCSLCPAAKTKFIAKGWPEKNILTIDQCEDRFGFRPDHVPFEFGEPIAAKVTEKTVTKTKSDGMTHSEMVALHNRLHGGGSWTWPGDLATHLETVHGVSTGKTTTTTRTVQQSSYCPGGKCPTNRTQRRGGLFRGWFR